MSCMTYCDYNNILEMCLLLLVQVWNSITAETLEQQGVEYLKHAWTLQAT